MKTEHRIWLVKGLCWLCAIVPVWQLALLSPTATRPAFKRPVSARVRVAPPPQNLHRETREQLRIPAIVAPAKKSVVKTVKTEVSHPEPDKKQVEPPPAAAPELPVPLPNMAFEQPGLIGAPPAPPDDIPLPAHFDDKPGGSVLVLAVNLNSDNKVIATDILVQSSSPLNDLAFSMSTFGVIWKNVEPPIPLGQFRWVEVRIDYDSEKKEVGILP